MMLFREIACANPPIQGGSMDPCHTLNLRSVHPGVEGLRLGLKRRLGLAISLWRAKRKAQ